MLLNRYNTIKSTLLHVKPYLNLYRNSSLLNSFSKLKPLKYTIPSDLQTSILQLQYNMIDNEALLYKMHEDLSCCSDIAIDLEALCSKSSQKNSDGIFYLGEISLIQLSAPNISIVFLVDVLTLGKSLVFKYLNPLFSNSKFKFHFFDLRRDIEALGMQLNLKPISVIDHQLLHTCVDWARKGINKRPSLKYSLYYQFGLERAHSDTAVSAAMTLGNRLVWDTRPLPTHFMNYAADDVRHLLLFMSPILNDESYLKLHNPLLFKLIPLVEEMSKFYVNWYSQLKPVQTEADSSVNIVNETWLEKFIGPAGKCSHCNKNGHAIEDCFQLNGNTVKCSHCGKTGHTVNNCFKLKPQLTKCTFCHQIGHNESKCFAKIKQNKK